MRPWKTQRLKHSDRKHEYFEVYTAYVTSAEGSEEGMLRVLELPFPVGGCQVVADILELPRGHAGRGLGQHEIRVRRRHVDEAACVVVPLLLLLLRLSGGAGGGSK